MSATYKCNWCGEELHKHINSYHDSIYVDRILHGIFDIASVHVTVDIATDNRDLDLCEKCMNDIKKEAFIKNINLC